MKSTLSFSLLHIMKHILLKNIQKHFHKSLNSMRLYYLIGAMRICHMIVE